MKIKGRCAGSKTGSDAKVTESTKPHATQINLWKKQLLNGAEDVFLDGIAKTTPKATDEPEPTELYE